MITNMLVVVVLGGQGQQAATKSFKFPIYDYDHKTNAPLGHGATKLPLGFTDESPRSGKISSKAGTIFFSVSKSGVAIPTPQRNPEAKKDEVWTTIRLVKWIGWRNLKGSTETYKISWTGYRMNIMLNGKSKSDIPTLRKALSDLVDNVNLQY